MVGHGEVHHACGALLLGQFQTSPALEHLGLGVLVCDSLELCTHRHSRQVGNIAAILQENLCAQYIELMGLGFGIGIRRRDLVINRGDLHIVCGHREGDGLAVDIHRISGQTLLDLPVAEGHALRLPCNESDFLTKCTLFWLPVHGQGVGVLLVLRFQRNFVCGHLEGNSCLGGVRTLGHAIYLPTSEGETFLLGCGNRDVLIKDTRFVHAVHGQGVAVLLVLRGQRDVVCGHLEGNGCTVDVRVSGQAFLLPAGEGVACLLGCGGNELCVHRHSCQVGNSAAVLQGDLCIGDLEVIGLGSICDILRVQRDLVCGHLEGNGRAVDVRISRQTGCRPTSEGVTVLLGCGGNELCAHTHSRQVGNSAAVLQGDLCIGNLELIGLGSVLSVLRFQRNVVCGHLEGDSCTVDVRVSGQAFLLPTVEGVARLLGCGSNELCTHRHSRQVGNSAAVLQGDLCIGDLESIGLGSVLGVFRLQRNLVCGHLEGNGRLAGVHIIRQTGHFPAGKGLAFHRLCNNRNVLIKDTRFVLPIHGQGVGVLLVLRGQRDVVCGHRECNSCIGGLRTLGHTIYLPTGEGAAFLLGCGKRDFLTKCTAFFLPVHGQGVVDRLIAVRHPHVIAGHEELEFDLRAGIGDGIRILCQTFDLPDDVIAFLLVNAKGNRSAHFALLTFLSIPVVVILRLGLLGHNIGIHFVLGAIVVVTIIHHDVDRVGACFGRLRHRRERAILRVILDGILRGILKIHLAVIGCSLSLGVIRKVGAVREIFAYHLADIKRAVCVLVALLRYDALLVDAR